MRHIKILEPVDGFEKGDLPEVTGPKGRELIAAGKAKWATKAEIKKLEKAPE